MDKFESIRAFTQVVQAGALRRRRGAWGYRDRR